MKAEVVHLVPALFGAGGIVGGAERYALELARHMADRLPTKLVSFGDQARSERMGALQIEVIGNPWYVRGQRSNPVSVTGLVRELAGARVVHCHQHHVLSSSLAAMLCRATGRKVFVSDLGGGGWDLSAYVSTDGWYHAHLHISQYSRRVFGHDGKAWARVIYGGVDLGKFRPPSAAGPRDRVVFVGRLMPHKGINYLIEALPPDLPLQVIGRPYHEEYTRELRRLAEGKQVEFRHDCGDAEIVEAYQRAICIVLPSVYKTLYGFESKVPELLGQTLLEGMACGAPGIGTDVASLPEVVEHGVSGFIVAPNSPESLREALGQLRGDPARVIRMGDAARKRVETLFTWPTVVDRCLEAYEEKSGGPAA